MLRGGRRRRDGWVVVGCEWYRRGRAMCGRWMVVVVEVLHAVGKLHCGEKSLWSC